MKRLPYITLLVLATAAFFVSCATAPPSRPIEDVRAAQLKKLLDEHAVLMLVDTRTEYEFRKGHVPSAVNIPPFKFDVLATLLPQDKDVHLIFYCRGVGCEPSKQAAAAAKGLGYRNVDLFLEGYPAWVAKGYPIEVRLGQ